MTHFHYRQAILYCEKVNIEELARTIPTPFYLYSYDALVTNYKMVSSPFASLNPLIAYSMKANYSWAICQSLANLGCGFDIVSGGELRQALRTGVRPDKILFAGVGKAPDEIEQAIKAEIMMFNIESLPEAYVIDEIAKILGRKARAAIRVNPDIDPNTHKYITTGTKRDKFGINFATASDVIREIRALPHIEFMGLHSHIGSQLLNPEVYVSTLQRLEVLINKLKRSGIQIQTLNLGGGFGIAYEEGHKAFDIAELADKIVPTIQALGCRLILEPGRFLVGSAGILVTKVLYVKRREDKVFVIVDAGMNDLIRPSLYAAYHRIMPVRNHRRQVEDNVDIVGPVCESADFLGLSRRFPTVESGEYLAVCDAGAYGYVMSSNYNFRPRCAEIMVRNSRHYVIREREQHRDIIKHEKLPPFLQKSQKKQ
jgi:diaminopimelate decarboxylase